MVDWHYFKVGVIYINYCLLRQLLNRRQELGINVILFHEFSLSYGIHHTVL